MQFYSLSLVTAAEDFPKLYIGFSEIVHSYCHSYVRLYNLLFFLQEKSKVKVDFDFWAARLGLCLGPSIDSRSSYSFVS